MPGEGQLWTLDERPIMHPSNIVPEDVRLDVSGAISAEMAVLAVNEAGVTQIQQLLDERVGVDRPIEGFEALHEFGVAADAAAAAHEQFATELVDAAPGLARKLGAWTAAHALGQFMRAQLPIAASLITDEVLAWADQVIDDQAASYVEADRARAVEDAWKIRDKPAISHREQAVDIVTGMVKEARALPDDTAADAAADFWKRHSVEPGAAAGDAACYSEESAAFRNPAPDRRVQVGSPFVRAVVEGATANELSPAELASSTPREHFRTGASLAMAYVALATKRAAVQAAHPSQQTQ